MTESQIIAGIFGVVITGIQLSFGFFLKKYLDRVDQSTLTIARIEGKLDVGSNKMKNMEDDIEDIEDRLQKQEINYHGIDARLGSVEVKCKLSHP